MIKPKNKVYISNYESTGTASIDEFFFSFIGNYSPSDLTKETKSDNGF